MASNTEFMVMTINAGGARRVRKEKLNPKKIANKLSQLLEKKTSKIDSLDIIAVQESHQVRESEGEPFSETSEELVQELGESYYKSYFREYLDSDSHAHYKKWDQLAFRGFDWVKQGNAVITNTKLAPWPWGLPPESYPGYNKLASISTQISRASLYSTGNRDTEPRNLIVVPLLLRQRDLFSLNMDYKKHLKAGEVDGQLREAFKNKDISLPEKAKISKINEKKWYINDGTRYTIEETNKGLKICESVSLYIMATHLTTLKGEDRHDSRNPQSKSASDVRLAQVREILRIVDELREVERNENLKPIPIILAGDFNAKPDSPELNALEQTFLRPEPRWPDGLIYRGSVWTHIGHKIHVDHIFYNDPVGLLTPIDCFVLDPSQVKDVTDHLPVVAKFQIQSDE